MRQLAVCMSMSTCVPPISTLRWSESSSTTCATHAHFEPGLNHTLSGQSPVRQTILLRQLSALRRTASPQFLAAWTATARQREVEQKAADRGMWPEQYLVALKQYPLSMA